MVIIKNYKVKKIIYQISGKIGINFRKFSELTTLLLTDVLYVKKDNTLWSLIIAPILINNIHTMFVRSYITNK